MGGFLFLLRDSSEMQKTNEQDTSSCLDPKSDTHSIEKTELGLSLSPPKAFLEVKTSLPLWGTQKAGWVCACGPKYELMISSDAGISPSVFGG